MSLCTRFRNFQCCNTENLNSRRYICVYSLPSRQHSFKSIPFRLPMSEMTGCLCQFGVFRSTGSASHIPSRFPDLQIDTRLLLLALWGKQWNLRSLIPCIQWPDRSGISPDSLSDIQTIFWISSLRTANLIYTIRMISWFSDTVKHFQQKNLLKSVLFCNSFQFPSIFFLTTCFYSKCLEPCRTFLESLCLLPCFR